MLEETQKLLEFADYITKPSLSTFVSSSIKTDALETQTETYIPYIKVKEIY